MKGYNKNEIKKIKEIDVIDYLLQNHPAQFKYEKAKQQLSYKANPFLIGVILVLLSPKSTTIPLLIL